MSVKTIPACLGALLLTGVGLASTHFRGPREQSADRQARDLARVSAAYQNLPLSFEPNRGQTDKQVRFMSRGEGYSLFLTPNEAVLRLQKGGSKTDAGKNAAAHTNVLRMKLTGANPTPRLAGVDPQKGRYNYLLGNDPRKWLTDVPHFGKVRYDGVYPGIDLVYYGNQRQLEYDFVVAPGADPSRIKLSFHGADRVSLDERGELLLHTSGGVVRQNKPFLYQEAGGKRQQVVGRYTLMASNQVGFEVAGYDTSRPLVIDPVLSYSSYLGGAGRDESTDIAVDTTGNAYVTGLTGSADFPSTTPFDPDANGGTDTFVTKITNIGSQTNPGQLVYSTYVGGDANENLDTTGAISGGIAVDSTGRAYVTGFTLSTNFPLVQPLQVSNDPNGSAYVFRLSPDGQQLEYSTFLGGRGKDAGYGIAVDPNNNVYVVGETNSNDFNIVNAAQPTFGGVRDAFVTRLNASGTGYIYSTYLGGSGDDRGQAVAVDPAGSVYLTGVTVSQDFPTRNPFQAGNRGTTDAFVTRLTPQGSIDYSSYLGGSGENFGTGIAVDGAGQAYVTGFTTSTDFPTTPNSFQSSVTGRPIGGADGFVVKINSAGSGAVYSTYLGGSGTDLPRRIAVSPSGSSPVLAYVTGSTNSPDFPVIDALRTSPSGGLDAFVTKLAANGGAAEYSTYLGGAADDYGTGIAVDTAGNAYVAGTTVSANFPVILPQDGTFNGVTDVFVAKLASPPAAPSNLTVVRDPAAGNRTANLSWVDNSDNETGFEIERQQGNGAFAPVATVGPNVTTYQDTPLAGGTVYNYRVRAVNAIGASPYSNASGITTVEDPPTAPDGLTVTPPAAPAGITQLILRWNDNSNNETGFKVERSNDNGATFTQVALTGPNVRTATDFGLTANTTYVYRVRATNAGGDSAFTTNASGTTLPNAPAPVSALVATPASSTSITLRFNDNSGNEDNFIVQRSTDGVNFTQIQVLNPGVTTFTDTGLTANTPYFYRVIATNAGGSAAPSNVATTRTFPTPPQAPSNLMVVTPPAPNGITRLTLTWTDGSTNEDGFKIERSTDGTTFTQVGTVGANLTTFTDTSLTANTTYTYRVRAFNAGGDSVFTNTANGATLPAPPIAPTDLVVSVISQTALKLDWADKSDNESGFKIERSDDGGATFTQVGVSPATVATFNDMGLTANTTYIYRVRATNAGGDSAPSNDASGTTLPNVPTAPVGLVATLVSPTQVNLAFTDNSANETGFKIERSIDGGQNFQQIATAPANGTNIASYSDTGLAADRVYIYRVRATNTGGDSPYTNTATQTTPPAPPSGLTATASAAGEIRLFFIDNSGTETGFQLERINPDGTVVSTPLAANSTTFTQPGLAANTAYQFRVRALNGGLQSDASNLVSVTTLPNAPAGPTNLTVSPVSQTSLRLTWSDVSNDESGFKIERSENGGLIFTEIAAVGANVTSFTDVGLTTDVTYQYRVRATNAGGDSAYSNTASGTTLPDAPGAPTGLTVTTPPAPEGESQLTLTWTDNSGNNGTIRIERRQGNLGFTEVATVAAGAETFTDTGLVEGATYTYRIRANNVGGDSPFSREATGSTLPAAPSGLRVQSLGGGRVQLDFTNNSAANVGFRVERRAGNGSFTQIATLNPGVQTFTDTGLASGQTFRYRVRAFNAAGNSAFSNEGQITTTPGIASITLTPATVKPGATVRGTIQLSGRTTGRLVVNLSSSDESVANVPRSVTISSGKSSATFSFKVKKVREATSVTITATQGGDSRSASVEVSGRRTGGGGGGGGNNGGGNNGGPIRR